MASYRQGEQHRRDDVVEPTKPTNEDAAEPAMTTDDDAVESAEQVGLLRDRDDPVYYVAGLKTGVEADARRRSG